MVRRGMNQPVPTHRGVAPKNLGDKGGQRGGAGKQGEDAAAIQPQGKRNRTKAVRERRGGMATERHEQREHSTAG